MVIWSFNGFLCESEFKKWLFNLKRWWALSSTLMLSGASFPPLSSLQCKLSLLLGLVCWVGFNSRYFSDYSLFWPVLTLQPELTCQVSWADLFLATLALQREIMTIESGRGPLLLHVQSAFQCNFYPLLHLSCNTTNVPQAWLAFSLTVCPLLGPYSVKALRKGYPSNCSNCCSDILVDVIIVSVSVPLFQFYVLRDRNHILFLCISWALNIEYMLNTRCSLWLLMGSQLQFLLFVFVVLFFFFFCGRILLYRAMCSPGYLTGLPLLLASFSYGKWKDWKVTLRVGKFRVKWKRQFATWWGASLGSNFHGSLEPECALSVSGRQFVGVVFVWIILAASTLHYCYCRDHVRDCWLGIWFC